MKAVNVFTELREMNAQYISFIAASNFSMGVSINGTLIIWGLKGQGILTKFLGKDFEEPKL